MHLRGTVVIVAVSRNSASVDVPITIAGGSAPASMTPWVTSESGDLKSRTAVSVSNGAFTATLAGTTVTTYVGKQPRSPVLIGAGFRGTAFFSFIR